MPAFLPCSHNPIVLRAHVARIDPATDVAHNPADVDDETGSTLWFNIKIVALLA